MLNEEQKKQIRRMQNGKRIPAYGVGIYDCNNRKKTQILQRSVQTKILYALPGNATVISTMCVLPKGL